MRCRTAVLTADDFVLSEVDLPAPAGGQLLARVRMASLDPYLAKSMQTWIGETPGWADGTVHGRILAEVVASQSEGIHRGDLITGVGRWQDYEVFDARNVRSVDPSITPPSLALGALSASGWTAWIGLHLSEVCSGQTVFISAATGTVGGTAGQLARRRGCRTVGLVGGEAKRRHAIDVLGFHACVDHTAPDLEGQVASVAGTGIDLVFENVGAPSIDAALPSMLRHGRILLCGLAAHYNSTQPATLRNMMMLLYKQIGVQPFAVSEHRQLLGQARRELHDGIITGAIKYDETITDGLENAPTAYLDMLAGKGLGKRLLRVSR